MAKRLQGIEMSGIRKMFELAGSDSVNMGLGEPDFDPPVHVQEALAAAVKEGHNNYGPSLGIPELRGALAHRIQRYRGRDVASENILVTAGATQGLMTVNQTFVERGDEVLVPDPGFVLYASQAKICGGTPVPYSLTKENGYLPDLDEIQAKITPATKMMVVNTPSNPVGNCFTPEIVRGLSEIAADAGIMVIADEVYDVMSYDRPHESFLGHLDNVIWVNSFSKTYAMTGWRIGCLAASADYIKALETMHYYTVACPPTPLQMGALAALEGPQDEAEAMVVEFKKRRDRISKRLDAMRGFDLVRPEGAFYAFPSYDFDVPSEKLALDLAAKGLICSPGSAFGALGENHLRFSYACSTDEIDRGMDILEAHAESLLLTN